MAPPIVHDAIESSGAPLAPSARALFEPLLGRDLSAVRVHTGDEAVRSADAVGSRAYAVGSHVVVGRGGMDPGTPAGRRLLAHELSHVVQASTTSVPARGTLPVGEPASDLERQADRAAARLAGGVAPEIGPVPAPAVHLRRQVATDGAAQATQTGTPADGGGVAQASPTQTPGQAPGQTQPAGQNPSDAQGAAGASDGRPGCAVPPGIPNSVCSAYQANTWWLPDAYVTNATCACTATPNVPTAMCVRKTLQDKLAATPGWLKAAAATAKLQSLLNPSAYEVFVQTMLTPRIYSDHVDAYRDCCCPSGPAVYPAWAAVTSIPIPSCALTGWFIDHFGSCHGTPGAW